MLVSTRWIDLTFGLEIGWSEKAIAYLDIAIIRAIHKETLVHETEDQDAHLALVDLKEVPRIVEMVPRLSKATKKSNG